MSYAEADEEERALKRKREAEAESGSEDWQPEAQEDEEAPMYSDEGHSSPEFAVYGLTQPLRNEFLRYIMTWGIPTSMEPFDWGALAMPLPTVHLLPWRSVLCHHGVLIL